MTPRSMFSLLVVASTVLVATTSTMSPTAPQTMSPTAPQTMSPTAPQTTLSTTMSPTAPQTTLSTTMSPTAPQTTPSPSSNTTTPQTSTHISSSDLSCEYCCYVGNWSSKTYSNDNFNTYTTGAGTGCPPEAKLSNTCGYYYSNMSHPRDFVKASIFFKGNSVMNLQVVAGRYHEYERAPGPVRNYWLIANTSGYDGLQYVDGYVNFSATSLDTAGTPWWGADGNKNNASLPNQNISEYIGNTIYEIAVSCQGAAPSVVVITSGVGVGNTTNTTTATSSTTVYTNTFTITLDGNLDTISDAQQMVLIASLKSAIIVASNAAGVTIDGDVVITLSSGSIVAEVMFDTKGSQTDDVTTLTNGLSTTPPTVSDGTNTYTVQSVSSVKQTNNGSSSATTVRTLSSLIAALLAITTLVL